MEEIYALARCRQWYSAHCATSLAALARSAECSAQQTNDHAANKWMRVIMPYNRSAVRVLVAARAWGVLESRRILARVPSQAIYRYNIWSSAGKLQLQRSSSTLSHRRLVALPVRFPPPAGPTSPAPYHRAELAPNVLARAPPKPAPVQVDTTLPSNRRHQPTRPILPTCCSPVQLLHLLPQCVPPGQP